MAADPRSFSNRYEVVRALARGGMAEVYLARDQLLDRPVAVKVLFPEYAREASFVERFRREAQAAANLSHPNIVAIYDWGQEDSTYFIVMEYVDGQSLRDLLRSRDRLSPQESAQIGADIAGALGYANRAGVVHRDVKPGNVLITPSGIVKVTDFGIARSGTSEGLTQTGSVMGTATYFSPEQAQGLPVDGRSDVYSLGVVLYEMVCGSPPFSGDTPVAVAYKHVREEVEPPSRRVPALPPDFERIVLAAMAKDVDSRYQSADDLRTDLLRFLRGQAPIAAPPVGPPVARRVVTEASPPSRRRAIMAIIGLLVLVGAVVAALVLLLGGGSGKAFATPNVVGQPEASARAALTAAGFKVKTEQASSDTVPQGSVISQDPTAGTKLHKGDTVTLRLSSGAGPVTVPDVTGQPFDSANVQLVGKGLRVNKQTSASENVQANVVISMDPPPGSQVQKGSTVTLVVSAGPAPVNVPNVAGDDSATAAGTLSNAGFRVRVVTQPNATVPSGQAIRTDPAANTPAQKGSTITLFVSSGPQNTTVPDVTSAKTTQSQAESILGGAGFKVQVVTVPSTPSNNGIVLAQNPNANTQAPQGSTVTITVGQSSSSSSSTSSSTG
jgi:beta-lactam-binding protein with PASTA domain/tRNA A-37 threonylcarbamoyl transferase component Bud32